MKLSPFAKRLGLVIAALNLFVAAMTALWLMNSREQYRTDALVVVDNLAQVLQASLTGTIRHIDLSLLTVADEYRRQSASGGMRPKVIEELLAEQRAHLPEIESLRIADARGDVRHGLAGKPGANLADRDFFIKARDDRAAGLMVGKPVLARIAKKWVVVFARRIETADGAFAGIVYINLALDRLTREFHALDVGASGSISLRDGELGLIAHRPEPESLEKVIGSRVVSSDLARMVAAGHISGSYIAKTSFDRIERAAAFRRLEPYPLYVLIGIAQDDFLSPWRKELAAGIAADLLFALVTLSSAWLLSQAVRRQEETARDLAQSELELKAIIDTEPECVKLLDADCRLLRMNRAGLRMIDADAESQVLGQDVTALIAPPHREAFRALTRKVFAGESGMLEFEAVGLKGRHVWLDTHATPLRDPAGTIVAALGVTRDVTERRRLREELEERVKERTAQLEAANRELEEFSYSMSHDMRTPLRAINGYSAVLLDDYGAGLDAEGRRLLMALADNGRRMGRLIDDILRFIGMARRKVKRVAFDMAATVRETLETVKAEYPGRTVGLEAGEIPAAWGDVDMIRQLLRELLSNAMKFSPAAGEVRIAVGGRTEGRENVYFVTDHGVGFDMRYADKLFKVFERVHATGQYEGTGIGLAIVKRIAERHGGRVWAEGREQGGATFYFALPQPDEPRQTATDVVTESAPA